VLEETSYGVATMRHNQPEIPVHVGFERWPIEHLKEAGIVDFVYGNPPCAAWSSAGSSVVQKKNWRVSPLLDCTRRHFTLLEELRPRVWVWESVTNAFTKGREFVDGLTARAVALGYSVTYLLHNAEHLGVPQRRLRFFFVATKVRFDVEEHFMPMVTAEEALRQLNDPGEPLDHNISKYQDLLPAMSAGSNLRQTWERAHPPPWPLNSRGQVAGRPCMTIRRIHRGQPAPVVMHELVHPTEDRGLSIKELATLCGYPPGYEFIGAKDAGQVGRGVCPPVGAWLAANVARCLERNEVEPAPTVQVIDVRDGTLRVTKLDPPTADGSAAVVPRLPAPPITDRSTAHVSATTAHRPTGSGAYLRGLIAQRRWTDQQLLDATLTYYPGGKTGLSDVAWNRGRLGRELGVPPTELRVHAPDPELPPGPENVAVAPSPVIQKDRSERQPARVRESVDAGREFDRTSLRANSHGQWIHRDYLAHAFRWAFAGRFVTGEVDVLDVGCGPDLPMVGVLTMPRNQVPRSYTGVDLNREPQKHPTRGWAKVHWEFNFIERWAELGQFDLVTNFEMIEHMHAPDGCRLLAGLAGCLRPGGTLLLSTPVFNGKAAANHLHEWEITELHDAITAAGLKVVDRFGTFNSQPDLRKVASAAELVIFDRLKAYYSGEVLACLFAPLYPDASRNNLWVLQHAD
jgi:DNA (cytosine-5)-methyltransferase 1